MVSDLGYILTLLLTDISKFLHHGLRTPNEGTNQGNLKFWANEADKIWDWDLIFSHAVKAISSPGVRSPCSSPNM